MSLHQTDALDLVMTALRKVFPGQEVTDTSDFFDLGGDSLTAQALCVELESATGQDLHPSLVFSAPTAETLAEEIHRFCQGDAP